MRIEKIDIPGDFIPKPLKIAALGDSLTEGVGASNEEGGYIHYLQNDLESLKGVKEVTFYNYGIRGHRSSQLLERIQEEEVKDHVSKADLIILTIGGNDVMKVVKDNFFDLNLDLFQEGKVSFEDNLNKIMKAVRHINPDAVILLIGLYNPFSQLFANIDEFNQILTDWNEAGQNVVAQYNNSYFVEIEDIFADAGIELLYEDLFHPNDKGYQLIADRVFEAITKDVEPTSEEWFVVKEEVR